MLLNAIMCVWNEEDIIESTIKHLFAQGCSNVFIVDNDSTDDTVKNAINAGGKLAAKFSTKDFNEDQKVAHLNAVVRNYNEQRNENKVWWLYVDADEFPHLEHMRIIDCLNMLDSSIRAVHGYMFNHIPTHPPYHVQGYHPADFQPLCSKSSLGKIPLLRYDKGYPHLFSIGGAHDFITHGEIIPTLRDFLQIHHFPYRNPEYTFKRSKQLAETRNEWYKKFLKQVKLSNTLGYEERYSRLKTIYKSNCLEFKTNTLIYDYTNIVRWYNIHTDKQFHSSAYDMYIHNAIYYFFMKEYDIALCRFNDAFNICTDDTLRLWLMVKIAECLALTDINDTHSLIATVKEYNNSEINDYINNNIDDIVNKLSKKHSKKSMRKVEFSKSVFPQDIEERYEKLIKEIKFHPDYIEHFKKS